MKLKVLGSSSNGNCYILTNGIETLIIEAGVRFKEVKVAVNFELNKVVGLIVSHSHLDHSRHVKDFLKSGIEVYSNKNCLEEREVDGHHRANAIEPNTITQIGNFKIIPFDVKHEVRNFGYLINHEETGNVLFLTDTYYSPKTFRGLNNILVEANYDQRIIDSRVENDDINFDLRGRILNSHMELQTTKNLLKANDLRNVNNIVLIHLSEGNSNEHLFKKEIAELTSKTVHVATKGLEIEFNKYPF